MKYFKVQSAGEPDPHLLARINNGICEVYAGGGEWFDSPVVMGWYAGGDPETKPITSAEAKAIEKRFTGTINPQARAILSGRGNE